MKKHLNEFELKFDERGNLLSTNLPNYLQGKEGAMKTFGTPDKKKVRDSLNRLGDAFIYFVDDTQNPLEFKIKTTFRNGGRLDK